MTYQALKAHAADCSCCEGTGLSLTAYRAQPTRIDGNRLLAALPLAERERWLPHLEPVALPLGKVLNEPGKAIGHVYFPTTAIVSLLSTTHDGGSAEIAAVGNEGLVGLTSVLGGGSMPGNAVVHGAGAGLRLAGQLLKTEFERSSAVAALLLRYTQALMTQMAQTVVCNRHHSLEQRLCRCLLTSLDRLPGSDIAMTHELLAQMLGVRREGVTEAALRLQRAGCIRYARGHIEVLDRPLLQRSSCECYAAVKHEYERLLPQVQAPPARPAPRQAALPQQFQPARCGALAEAA